MITALTVVMSLAALSAALLALGSSAKNEADAARDSASALYLAESGLNELIARFGAAAEDPTLDTPGSLGSQGAPLNSVAGTYWVDVQEVGTTYVLTSYGTAGVSQRALEIVLESPAGGVFNSALFAGNSSGDPTYSLDLGGLNGQADLIQGDIYSASDIELSGDSEVTGQIRAGGTITGADGEEGVRQAAPDIKAMNYEVNHDIDVRHEFLTGGSKLMYDDSGGYAYQLPEANPAHIFRVNPSDRSSETSSTIKDDFFLEDPYENVRVDKNQNGKDAYKITLSGTMGRPGESGTDKVYYIDGNLWIHNKKTYSLKFFSQGNDPTRVTFVVKGNIYFSDNMFYMNKQKDGVAFIAITDDDVEDSGNIYFGDPVFGTLEHMDAFMYAENNFYDNNLSASGSAEVTVVGNMTAGNQVAINRDWGDQHSKLTIEFDDRISAGELDLPGLPGVNSASEGYVVVSWREVALQP